VLAKKLKLCREKLRMSQIDAAASLHLGAKTLSDYERGVSEPNVEILKGLSKLYDVSLDYLLDSDYQDRLLDPVFTDLFDQLRSLPLEDLETIQIITKSLVIKNKDAASKLAKKAE